MVLSDVDIKRYIAEGKIKITPDLPPEQFGSCSVDFRLGNEFSVFDYSRHPYIDLKDKGSVQDIMRKVIVKDGEPFVLQPPASNTRPSANTTATASASARCTIGPSSS